MIKVVIFSGGRGSNSIVKELIKDPNIKLSLIVNAYDDGKSTGEIRRFFNMLGPSDIRKNQENLMNDNFEGYEFWKKLFEYRFPDDVNHDYCMNVFQNFIDDKTNSIEGIEIIDNNILMLIRKSLNRFIESLKVYEKAAGKKFNFKDCSLSNCLYAGVYELFEKDFYKTIDLFNILLHVKGEVIPTNLENKKLLAIRETGEICYNESEIVEIRSNVRIKNIFLLDEYLDKEITESLFKTIEEKEDYMSRIESFVHGAPRALKAIEEADIILYAPGTQHSSLYPSYMTLGIPEAIYGNIRALKFYIVNIGEDYETPGYKASEFLTGTYNYMCRNITHIPPMHRLITTALVNTSRSQLKADTKYVENDINQLKKLPIDIIYGKFEDQDNLGKHDAKITIQIIKDTYYKNFFERIMTNESYICK